MYITILKKRSFCCRNQTWSVLSWSQRRVTVKYLKTTAVCNWWRNIPEGSVSIDRETSEPIQRRKQRDVLFSWMMTWMWPHKHEERHSYLPVKIADLYWFHNTAVKHQINMRWTLAKTTNKYKKLLECTAKKNKVLPQYFFYFNVYIIIC